VSTTPRETRITFLTPETHTNSWHISAYYRAIDHMENCVGATHRAVLDADMLQAQGIW